jgi:hypothetical protein
MDDAELGAAFLQRSDTMDAADRSALIEAVFDAFRERGEGSEDAAEGAGTTLERITADDGDALRALMRYAQTSPGLLKEATLLCIERRPDSVAHLPPMLVDSITRRLTEATAR